MPQRAEENFPQEKAANEKTLLQSQESIRNIPLQQLVPETLQSPTTKRSSTQQKFLPHKSNVTPDKA